MKQQCYAFQESIILQIVGLIRHMLYFWLSRFRSICKAIMNLHINVKISVQLNWIVSSCPMEAKNSHEHVGTYTVEILHFTVVQRLKKNCFVYSANNTVDTLWQSRIGPERRILNTTREPTGTMFVVVTKFVHSSKISAFQCH